MKNVFAMGANILENTVFVITRVHSFELVILIVRSIMVSKYIISQMSQNAPLSGNDLKMN